MAFKLYTESSAASSAEKTIILVTLSAILAIFFDGKKKKPAKRKNFVQRTAKNYKIAGDSLNAYSAHRKKKQAEKEYGVKLERSAPIDITL